jgi:hypothetical protein
VSGPCCDICPMEPTCDEMAAMTADQREAIIAADPDG